MNYRFSLWSALLKCFVVEGSITVVVGGNSQASLFSTSVLGKLQCDRRGIKSTMAAKIAGYMGCQKSSYQCNTCPSF